MSPMLAGKVVVITGASGGLGAATALALGRRGCHLVLGARRREQLTEVAQQVRRLGGQAEVQICDVVQRAQVRELLALAQEKFSRVDVAIANAGFGLCAAVADITDAQMEEIWRVNFLGTWYVMAEAAALMRPRGAGHIIVISSAVARRALPYMGAYAATKAAQLSLVEAQRLELTGSGIAVSSVHPVSTRTDFFDVAAQRSGCRVKAMGIIQSAESVAEKIVRLVERPRPELWPHRASRWALGLAALLPALTDYAMRRLLRSCHRGKGQHAATH